MSGEKEGNKESEIPIMILAPSGTLTHNFSAFSYAFYEITRHCKYV